MIVVGLLRTFHVIYKTVKARSGQMLQQAEKLVVDVGASPPPPPPPPPPPADPPPPPADPPPPDPPPPPDMDGDTPLPPVPRPPLSLKPAQMDVHAAQIAARLTEAALEENLADQPVAPAIAPAARARAAAERLRSGDDGSGSTSIRDAVAPVIAAGEVDQVDEANVASKSGGVGLADVGLRQRHPQHEGELDSWPLVD